MSWETIELGELAKISKGKKYLESSSEKSKHRYINIEDLHGGNEHRYTDENGVTVNENDVIIAWDGANAGKVGVGFNGVIGSTLAKISFDKKGIDSKYIFWYLDSINAKIKSQRTGATIPHVNGPALRELHIPLPTLHIQNQIANILDKADSLRKKDQQLLQKYDELAQSIFIDMFGDPVKNEKGWEVKTIEQIVKKEKHCIKRGPFGGTLKKEIFVKKGYLVYEQYHALNNDFSFKRYFITEEKYNELSPFKIKPKDIIISCSGVYLGKLAIIPDNAEPGIINQALLKITLDEGIYRNEFFLKIFRDPNFKEKYFASERGAGIPNFPPMTEFKRFEFINPPIRLQNGFININENIQYQIGQLNKQISKSQNLFHSLLQKAFTGEII